MKLKFLLPLVLLAAAISQGCVSNKKYAELQTNYNRSLDTNSKLKQSWQTTQQELAVSRTQVESLQQQIDQAKANAAGLQDALNKCLAGSNQGNVNIAKLADQITASDKYIQHLVNLKNKSDSLNQILTTNLTRSLTSDEMRDVNVKVLKGVVYISLSDNMLYKSGSYQISDKAGATLGKIAKIINDYATYDVLIEGNTDNVPIAQTNIRNNWDLSALRASSVVQALQNTYNVDPKRLTAGGRGEYNPVADNSSDMGKSQNRRTEIIITPKLDQFMTLIGKPAPTSGQ
ncbi:OmpA/MotB family protein [Mucilaginibacter gotjawali]|uniref:Chemotaxis protein MotB n=2 Tax=Mucilaginibacter gotjawali TaxID=1550579 RepID=A0A839SIP5_9SPHI|nr:flagellar motor protein MotB [Mucilaginibacter gotjawali]MBB3058201.1 chemotaxis protein MotB [Mucilaginibacter gotjawali]BAU54843.1 putative lipoprotein YiaD precursor [Mucilaginibacter gotjawali]